MTEKDKLAKFSGSFKNKSRVDTDDICRVIRGKGNKFANMTDEIWADTNRVSAESRGVSGITYDDLQLSGILPMALSSGDQKDFDDKGDTFSDWYDEELWRLHEE
ncbi:hypothetical protein [Psychrobacillus sp. OK032]|uniref:hypothetical protein n=1 Tax=Psychrobacillus sp. OK032 TaxID=1884358 RepID=UPI0008B5B17C|nr:hypothetical protein [Psychrobacillus sp. OK032]SER88750.1 hypothetical protein SAMN05518872_102505 [Psychrobacillus sp. OK032]